MQTIQITEAGVELTFAIEFHEDGDSGAPWEESEGHGIVSGWERRSKRPSELILNESHGSKRFFDFAETCKIALRDGWDAPPYNDGSETPRQQAAKAARANYEYLRGWCRDEWRYVGVEVTLLDDEGEKTNVSESLWGCRDPGRSPPHSGERDGRRVGRWHGRTLGLDGKGCQSSRVDQRGFRQCLNSTRKTA